jgi:hypothetical protein
MPDQVEHVPLRTPLRPGGSQLPGQGGLQRFGTGGDVVQAAEDRRELRHQCQVVLRPERMGDDDLGRRFAPGADRLDRLAPVLVDVDEHVRRRQPAQLGQVHGLGAPDLGHPGQRGSGVDAPAGARDQPVAQPEGDHKLGQARHQAGDPHRHGVFAAHPCSVQKATVSVGTCCDFSGSSLIFASLCLGSSAFLKSFTVG